MVKEFWRRTTAESVCRFGSDNWTSMSTYLSLGIIWWLSTFLCKALVMCFSKCWFGLSHLEPFDGCQLPCVRLVWCVCDGAGLVWSLRQPCVGLVKLYVFFVKMVEVDTYRWIVMQSQFDAIRLCRAQINQIQKYPTKFVGTVAGHLGMLQLLQISSAITKLRSSSISASGVLCVPPACNTVMS